MDVAAPARRPVESDAIDDPVETALGPLAKFLVRYRGLNLFLTVVAYAAAVLASGDLLGISSNYFVLLPILAAAICFGTAGGLVSGALGLPANLLLFAVLGHPEYSPASKIVAESSGIFLGFACGRLADYFRSLENEIRRRNATEKALRAALEEKKLLLRELHHRVKNNLSVIKSLVQLQRNRSSDPNFIGAADKLIGRIFAISVVHDILDADPAFAMVDLGKFIEALVVNLESGLGLDRSRVQLDLEVEGCAIQLEAATSLGLIVNEALTNALKHASRPQGVSPDRYGANPSIRLSLGLENEPKKDAQYRLVIVDDGPGPAAGPAAAGGLGLKLVHALARNLGGTATLEAVAAASEGTAGGDGPSERRVAGARFELVFPATFMELI